MITMRNKTGMKDTYLYYKVLEELNRKNIEFADIHIEVGNEDMYYFAYCEYRSGFNFDLDTLQKLTINGQEI